MWKYFSTDTSLFDLVLANGPIIQKYFYFFAFF